MNRSPMKRSSSKRDGQRGEYRLFVAWLLADYDHACAFCKTERGPIDPHHTRKPRATYLMDPETVLPLCRRCHERAEAGIDDKGGRLMILGSRSIAWTMAMATERVGWLQMAYDEHRIVTIPMRPPVTGKPWRPAWEDTDV